MPPPPGVSLPAPRATPRGLRSPGTPACRRADPSRRPTTVTIAAIITWISTGLTVAFCVLVGGIVAATPAGLMDQINQDPNVSDLNLTQGEVVTIVLVMLGFAVVWCVAAFVLAIFVYRGAGWARIALTISAATAALVSLVMILSLVSLVTLLAAAAVIILMFTGGANAGSRGAAVAPPKGSPRHPCGELGTFRRPLLITSGSVDELLRSRISSGSCAAGPTPSERSGPWTRHGRT